MQTKVVSVCLGSREGWEGGRELGVSHIRRDVAVCVSDRIKQKNHFLYIEKLLHKRE